AVVCPGVAFMMPQETILFALDQRWTLAGARPQNGFAGCAVDRRHITSIHFNAGHAVSSGAAGDTQVFGGPLEGHLRCIQIVFTNVNHGKVPDGGEVQAFVKRSAVDGSVAKKRHNYLARFAQLRAQGRTSGEGDACSDYSVRSHEAIPGSVHMHASAAPAGAAGC